MKNPVRLFVGCVLALGALWSSSQAAVFFSDTFTGGSTLNQPPTTPTVSSASYQTYIGTTNSSSVPSMGPNALKILFPVATGVLGEAVARFTNSPINLNSVGDYVDLQVVFINTSNILSMDPGASLNNNATLNIGLFNSGGVNVNQGQFQLGTAAGQPAFSGGTEDWVGYVSRIGYFGNNRTFTRPAQTTNGVTSQNQDLLFTAASGSQAFNSPSGTSLGDGPSGVTNSLPQGSTNTLLFRITLTAPGTLTISNALYAGVGTGGTLLYSQEKTASGANFLTGGFDGMAVGWRNNMNSGSPGQGSAMMITSVEVTGQSTPDTTPPSLLSEPINATVPSGGTCAFMVVAQGQGTLTYQWHRYGTNLVNGGNISGATNSMLVISPASAADVASVANGYYVTVSDLGGSTNSVKCSLTLGTAKNLVWSGSGSLWDLNNSPSWVGSQTFNYGDSVTFNDVGSAQLLVTLSNDFLSASSVTVDGSAFVDYVFAGPGKFAGPGSLIYKGAGFLTLNNTNLHTGGTIVSNASAYLVVNNYNGLGSGPLTLAKAGGTMEIGTSTTGSATEGIKGDVIVNDNFSVYLPKGGSFSAVFLGNVTSTAGKTLTFNQGPTGINRIRFYSTNLACDANLALNGPATTEAAYYGMVLAPYASGGSSLQLYTGGISGNGGVIQRGSGLTVLSGQNTYSGGTTPSDGTIGFGASTVGSVTSGPIGVGPLYLNPEAPSTTGTGAVQAYGASRTIANPLQHSSGTNNLTLVISGTNDLTFTGTYTLNGNDGATTYTNRNLRVDSTALTTFAGPLSGTGFGLNKSGGGLLALGGNNTYDGLTTVSSGTLRVNGTLAGPVLVAADASLGGSGTINGRVTIQTNGILAPGSSIGTLTINNDLTIAGDLLIEVNRSGSASDRANVSGTLSNTGAGTVTVTNLGAALQAGDTFTLFNKAVTSGALLTVTGGGVTWTNKLAIDGTIAVLAPPVPTTGTNLTFARSGNTLTLSWPPDYLTWTLQTNAVGLSATNSWFPYPGSTSVTNVVITLNPALTNVYFRMSLP